MSAVAPQSDRTETFRAALLAMAQRVDPTVRSIGALARVSAGATLETWALDAERDGNATPLILRRSPGQRAGTSLPLPTEAAVIQAAAAQGLRVPVVWHVLTPEDNLGEGFLMERIAGETIPRRILRSLTSPEARERLVAQLGDTLAGLHAVAVDRLPALRFSDAGVQLDHIETEYRRQEQRRPVFDLALKWLRARQPAPVPAQLVHGDFRNGNVIVGDDGLRAVLDWEIAHLGDPAEDLAWIQLPPWRFGELDNPVGGIGPVAPFYAAYAARSGQPVDIARVRFWQVFGSLRWGVATAGMVAWLRGHDPSVERAMIARRASENEIDLMRAIMDRD